MNSNDEISEKLYVQYIVYRDSLFSMHNIFFHSTSKLTNKIYLQGRKDFSEVIDSKKNVDFEKLLPRVHIAMGIDDNVMFSSYVGLLSYTKKHIIVSTLLSTGLIIWLSSFSALMAVIILIANILLSILYLERFKGLMLLLKNYYSGQEESLKILTENPVRD